MSKRLELTGKIYGRLTVIRFAYVKNKATYWICRCECGNDVIVKGANLNSGNSKSCGCLEVENRQHFMDVFSDKYKKHGMGHSRLSGIWYHMKDRCNNPNNKDYAIYGGRGIRVCDEWNHKDGFVAFYEWSMKNGYNDSLTIDRIDTNGNYEPSNCRWSDETTQANNRRTNKLVTIDGVTKTFAEWCRDCNVDYFKVRDRWEYGWTIEEALELKPRE